MQYRDIKKIIIKNIEANLDFIHKNTDDYTDDNFDDDIIHLVTSSIGELFGLEHGTMRMVEIIKEQAKTGVDDE